MKIKSLAIVTLITSVVFLVSCSHQVGVIGVGTGFRVGGGEYGVSYGDGLFGTFVSKDGIHFKAELDSTQGFSFDPSTNSYKGIKSVEYSVAPQINGYAVDFSQKNPEVAKAYYDALIKYYEIQKEQNVARPAMISDEKSKSASTDVSDILKKAIDAAKSIIGKKEQSEGKDAVFQCDGNCEYTNLAGNDDIGYQLSIAMKLLAYDGYSHSMAETGEYYKTTLEHFLSENVAYQAKGHTTTPLRVKAVTVKNGVIEHLSYVMRDEDGDDIDIECPSCVSMPE